MIPVPLPGFTATMVALSAVVGPGVYTPLYPAKGFERVPVAAFELDLEPVTNAEFLAFVRLHPEWRRGSVNPLLADRGYLGRWAGGETLGQAAPDRAPVVEVSWFAARAYCDARGARLPTEAEWELAAAASATAKDGREDPAYLQEILSWYGSPSPEVLPEVGGRPANAWGVRDLHGLVWEWVEDFNATLASVDNRSDKDPDRGLYCGGGAAAAAAKDDYAAFMRVAFRSSLSANYTTSNLGFRCARDP